MTRADRPRILSLLGCYWPGNESTGPNQSFRAFAQGLKGDFDIQVVARDGSGMAPVGWQTSDIVPLKQLPLRRFGARGLLELLRETPHDILLLNGFHDREFTIPALVFRKLGLIPTRPTILSSRGEFATGALSLKSGRKRLYRNGMRAAGLTRDIWMHATAEHERRDIQSAGLSCRGILLAPNARTLPDQPATSPRQNEAALRIAFLGRLARVKNIQFALRVLAHMAFPITFDIYGPKIDSEYCALLQKLIEQLPSHIVVTLQGPLPHEAVSETLASYDLFFLPTLGENFGHAINEALASGVPVLISDKTPWRDLARSGAGWDLPLDNPAAFVDTIERVAKMPPEYRAAARRAARALAEKSFAESDALEANRHMLRYVLEHEETTP